MSRLRFHAIRALGAAPSAALFVALLLVPAAPAAAAGQTLECPALAAATQLEACPTEEQLRHSYIGHCSDNQRLYDRDVVACERYEAFRRLKNVALWEAGADGAFQGYLSCELPRERILAAAPLAVGVSRERTVTRVRCSYSEGVTMTLRTKARCTVQGEGRCAGNPAACRVACD
jgi:hypothetical protein